MDEAWLGAIRELGIEADGIAIEGLADGADITGSRQPTAEVNHTSLGQSLMIGMREGLGGFVAGDQRGSVALRFGECLGHPLGQLGQSFARSKTLGEAHA